MNIAELQRRIMDRVEMIPFCGCWLWLGYTESNGYARMSFAGAPTKWVHRLSYIAFVGPIPDGLDVLHSCDIGSCASPQHLSVGTPTENAAQMVARERHPIALAAQQKTHCLRGHQLSGSNLVINSASGTRSCRQCHNELRRKRGSNCITA